jgi:uncharacterized protein (DUF983 family)
MATIGRGARRRCGRCGTKGVLDGFFRLKERCPNCGYRFNREEGFFTGVFLVNFGVTIALMWVVIMAYVLWRAGTDSDSGLWPILTVSVGIALITPIVYYPFAATTWAALDLVLRPLEPDEEAEAAIHAAAPD